MRGVHFGDAIQNLSEWKVRMETTDEFSPLVSVQEGGQRCGAMNVLISKREKKPFGDSDQYITHTHTDSFKKIAK